MELVGAEEAGPGKEVGVEMSFWLRQLETLLGTRVLEGREVKRGSKSQGWLAGTRWVGEGYAWVGVLQEEDLWCEHQE